MASVSESRRPFLSDVHLNDVEGGYVRRDRWIQPANHSRNRG